MSLRHVFMYSAFGVVCAFGSVAHAQTSNINADDFFPEVRVEQVTKPSDKDTAVQFLADAEVTLAEPARNDVYAVSETVHVKNTVDGDVFAAGNTITIEETVTGSVRIAGNTVTINGDVKRNTLIMGNTVTITDSATLNGNVRIYAETLTMNGTISGSAEIDVKNMNGNGRYLGTASIRTANSDITLHNADVERVAIETTTARAWPIIGKMLTTVGTLISLAFSILFGSLIVIFAFPIVERGLGALNGNILALFGRGVLINIAALLALILTAFTLIGIPFAIVGFGLLVFFNWVGKILIAYWVGMRLTRSTASPKTVWLTVGTVALGCIILLAIDSVPYIGTWIVTIASITGFGALALSLKK